MGQSIPSLAQADLVHDVNYSLTGETSGHVFGDGNLLGGADGSQFSSPFELGSSGCSGFCGPKMFVNLS